MEDVEEVKKKNKGKEGRYGKRYGWYGYDEAVRLSGYRSGIKSYRFPHEM